MKIIILSCVSLLFIYTHSFGATDCKVVEFPDHSEAICTGDEKAKILQEAYGKPSQTMEVPQLSQKQTKKAPIVKRSQAPLVTDSPVDTSVEKNLSGKKDTRANKLARRKQLAEKNTRSLKDQIPAADSTTK